jgi:hypothetical protein
VNGKDVIAITREAVANAQAAGLKTIDPKALLNLLDLLDKEVTATDQSRDRANALAQLEIEKYKAELASWVSKTQHVSAWELEGFKQVIALGQSAIKSVTLINGGAAVALLAFIGHLAVAATSKYQITPFAESLRYFVAGVLCSALASGTTYLSQYFYSRSGKWWAALAITFHLATVLVTICAFAAFIQGASLAYHAFLSAAP